MFSVLKQIAAVTAMNVKGIPQRAWLSIATIVSIAMVVGVLLAFLAMAAGFEATTKSTGAPDVAVALRSGAEAELNSGLTREQAVLMETGPGIARGADGKPLVSPELYVVVDGAKPGAESPFNLPLRGVGPNAIAVRRHVGIVAGRLPAPGTNEILVGRSLAKEFQGFEIGSAVSFGTTKWQVVGIFETGGSVFESEIWADLSVVQSLFNRGSSVQVLRIKLTEPAAIDALKAFNEAEPRLKLDIMSEEAYYASQASGTSDLIFYVGWPLGIAMAFGALAGAINTMYSSVDARQKEIATLRAIGFGGFSAFCGTIAESLALAIIGGMLGTLAVYVFFDGLTASTLGGSFTQIVFQFKLTAALAIKGVTVALVVGLLGGVAPAARAARLPIVLAYRN